MNKGPPNVVVPRLKQLVTGFSQGLLGFMSRPLHIEIRDRVALGQVFLLEVCFTLSVSLHGYSIFVCHKHYAILAMDSVV
jgi:hypothetical protein